MRCHFRCALYIVIAFAPNGLGGCNAIAGLGDYQESPCEGSCIDGDGASDGGDDADFDVSLDANGDALADASTDTSDSVFDVAFDTFVDGGLDSSLRDTLGVDTDIDSGADVDSKCDGAVGGMITLGGHAIDQTEVTNAQYAAFLATAPTTAGQGASCTWNATFTPAGTWPLPESACNQPVANVDWCDATAYCAWAGKRLCGHPITGSVPFMGGSYVDELSDEWFDGCTSGGANQYPYPGSYIARFCVDASYDGKLGTRPVSSVVTCQPTATGYKGLFDQAGNVAEWEDCCDKTGGAMDHCRVRGGSYLDDAMHASCSANTVQPRNAARPEVGLRCCAK